MTVSPFGASVCQEHQFVHVVMIQEILIAMLRAYMQGQYRVQRARMHWEMFIITCQCMPLFLWLFKPSCQNSYWYIYIYRALLSLMQLPGLIGSHFIVIEYSLLISLLTLNLKLKDLILCEGWIVWFINQSVGIWMAFFSYVDIELLTSIWPIQT